MTSLNPQRAYLDNLYAAVKQKTGSNDPGLIGRQAAKLILKCATQAASSPTGVIARQSADWLLGNGCMRDVSAWFDRTELRRRKTLKAKQQTKPVHIGVPKRDDLGNRLNGAEQLPLPDLTRPQFDASTAEMFAQHSALGDNLQERYWFGKLWDKRPEIETVGGLCALYELDPFDLDVGVLQQLALSS